MGVEESMIPALVGIISLCASACAAVAFLWARSNVDRREAATSIANVRSEFRADIQRIHERLDALGKEKIDRGELTAIREDFRQIRDQLAELNTNIMKFMTAAHAAE